MYCLCVNVYCHWVTTELQLTYISYHIISYLDGYQCWKGIFSSIFKLPLSVLTEMEYCCKTLVPTIKTARHCVPELCVSDSRMFSVRDFPDKLVHIQGGRKVTWHSSVDMLPPVSSGFFFSPPCICVFLLSVVCLIPVLVAENVKKGKDRLWVLQHWCLKAYCTLTRMSSFISRGAAHTKRRERPLLAKEGTIPGI